MSETTALRTTNERGYVFTFNKLFDSTIGNFNVTFNTTGGNAIYTLLDQGGSPTTNITLLSVDKIQTKLAVGFFGRTNYRIEQTDFSTFDRFKLYKNKYNWSKNLF